MTDIERRLAEIEASGVTGPNKLAAMCEAMIPALIAERDAAKTRAERKRLAARIRTNRTLLKWAKTRAGYLAPQ